jgi:hypothetical protein
MLTPDLTRAYDQGAADSGRTNTGAEEGPSTPLAPVGPHFPWKPFGPGGRVRPVRELLGRRAVGRPPATAKADPSQVDGCTSAVLPARWSIAYAVLSFGGFLGMGDKLFAVPWKAMTLVQDEEYFLLDVDKAVLEDAPGFDKDSWPDFSDSNWGQGIHDHYGTAPYWKREGEPSAGGMRR